MLKHALHKQNITTILKCVGKFIKQQLILLVYEIVLFHGVDHINYYKLSIHFWSAFKMHFLVTLEG